MLAFSFLHFHKMLEVAGIFHPTSLPYPYLDNVKTLPLSNTNHDRKYSGTEYFDASDGQMASINEVASAIDCNIYQETDSPVPVSGKNLTLPFF